MVRMYVLLPINPTVILTIIVRKALIVTINVSLCLSAPRNLVGGSQGVDAACGSNLRAADVRGRSVP